jgi:hypothetical protein
MKKRQRESDEFVRKDVKQVRLDVETYPDFSNAIVLTNSIDNSMLRNFENSVRFENASTIDLIDYQADKISVVGTTQDVVEILSAIQSKNALVQTDDVPVDREGDSEMGVENPDSKNV